MKQTVNNGEEEESDLQHDASDDVMKLVFRALA